MAPLRLITCLAFGGGVTRRHALTLTHAGVAATASTAAAAANAYAPALEANRTALLTPKGLDYYFYTDVKEETCAALNYALEESAAFIERRKDTPPLRVHVQSLGGNVLPALHASDRIAAFGAHTYVDGYAASAATLLTVAGRKRFMTSHSLILVHELRSALAMNKLSTLQTDERNLEIIENAVVDIYQKHTNLSPKELRMLMAQERWLTASEALTLGFVDVIL